MSDVKGVEGMEEEEAVGGELEPQSVTGGGGPGKIEPNGEEGVRSESVTGGGGPA